MPKASRRNSASRRQRRSSRRVRYEDPLARIHRIRRKMQRERKRLGLSMLEYMDYRARKHAEPKRRLKRQA